MTDVGSFVVLGATGHVGSAVAHALLADGQSVTAVTRDEEKAVEWRRAGAEAQIVDVSDVDALRAVFKTGRRAFLLNPPAAPNTDTDVEEHRTMTSIVAALDTSGLEKLVLQSSYGARAGDRLGDLSVLYDFERALYEQPIPASILRAAYYLSNWDGALVSARNGTLKTMFPADFVLPMVAPADVGPIAARLLRETPGTTELQFIEGPERYTPQDVADAFAQALNRKVELEVTPRNQWQAAYRSLGFSAAAADAYARMTAASIDAGTDLPDRPARGQTTLQAYIQNLVAQARSSE